MGEPGNKILCDTIAKELANSTDEALLSTLSNTQGSSASEPRDSLDEFTSSARPAGRGGRTSKVGTPKVSTPSSRSSATGRSHIYRSGSAPVLSAPTTDTTLREWVEHEKN